MSTYDILMLVVLIGCVVFGAWKGMAWQLASLSSFVVSYFVALNFSGQLAPVISDQEPYNRFIAMLVLYLGTSLAIWMAFRIVARVIDRVKLKEFDRQLGALFGGCKGVLLCVVITFFAVTLTASSRGLVLNSRSGHYIALLLDRAHPLIPEGAHEILHPYFEKLEKGLEGGPDDEESEEPGTAVVDGEGSTGGILELVERLRQYRAGNPDGDPIPALSEGLDEDQQAWLIDNIDLLSELAAAGTSALAPTDPTPPDDTPATSPSAGTAEGPEERVSSKSSIIDELLKKLDQPSSENGTDGGGAGGGEPR